MKNYQLPKVPENVQIPFTAVCNILANLCKTKLNEEYLQASRPNVTELKKSENYTL